MPGCAAAGHRPHTLKSSRRSLKGEVEKRISISRRASPGGHWNDAYPFVSLHQPSAFYGVGSLELGTGRTDTAGKPGWRWRS